MNSSHGTNITSNSSEIWPESDPWVESGAMVYVALTVATFSAVIMCCTWFAKEHWTKTMAYTSIDSEEHIELTGRHSIESDEEVNIPLDFDHEAKSPPETKSPPEPEASVFTLDDPSDSEDEADSDEAGSEHEVFEDNTATV